VYEKRGHYLNREVKIMI